MNMLLILIATLLAPLMIYYTMFYLPAKYEASVDYKIGHLAEQQKEMGKLRDQTNVERVLILKSHNGDGVPKPGFQIKVTALYQSWEPPFKNVVDTYDGLEVDGEYVVMLDRIRREGYVAFFTHQLPLGSLLREIYEKEGVNWSYIFFIASDRTNWYYASLATSQAQSPFQQGDELAVRMFVNKIRNMYRKKNSGLIRQARRALWL